MKSGMTKLLSIMAFCVCCGTATAQPKKTQLGLENGEGTPSLRESLKKDKQDEKLDRLLDSLNQHASAARLAP